jgi:trimethylamine---corrinoid protein Co-methyltransferase
MIPTTKVLSDQELSKIDQVSRELLWDTGVKVENEEALQIYKKAGAQVNFSNQIVKIPNHIINETIAKCSPSVRLYGRDGVQPLLIGGDRVYFGTIGISTNILDLETGKYRPVLYEDLGKIIRLADVLNPPEFLLIPATPTDVPPEVSDLYEFKSLVTNTKKHFIAQAKGKENLKKIIDMAKEITGSLEALQKQPFFSILVCLTSPLINREDGAELIIETARMGLPLFIESGPMCGGTAPATLASTLIMANAEILCSFVLAKSVNPTVPLVYASWARILDMKSATVSHGGPEFALLRCGTTQMAKYYGLPSGGGGILGDSKLIDAQLGMEKLGTALLPAQAGTNMILGMGLLADENAISLETLVVDYEVAGYVRRVLQGIEVNDETTDITRFKEVEHGGDFVSTEYTREHFREEMWIPMITDRGSLALDKDPKAKSMENRTKRFLMKAFEQYKPPTLPKDIDSKLDAIIFDR